MRINCVADVAGHATPLLGTADAGDVRGLDVVKAEAETEGVVDFLSHDQVQGSPVVAIVTGGLGVANAGGKFRAFGHDENDGGLVAGRPGDAAWEVDGPVSIHE